MYAAQLLSELWILAILANAQAQMPATNPSIKNTQMTLAPMELILPTLASKAKLPTNPIPTV